MNYVIIENKDLADFGAWSGGRDTLNTLIERGDCDAVESLIEEVFSDHTPEDVEINDFLWFETDTIAEHLGYADWDAYERGEQDEQDEEDEDEDEEDEEDEEAKRQAEVERAGGILQERFPRIKWSIKMDYARYCWDSNLSDEQNCEGFSEWMKTLND